MNRGTTLALWAVTIVAGFAVGWSLASPGADAPPEDMGAAIRAALAEGDVLERLERTTRLLQQLDSENLPEVLEVYDQMLPVIDQWDIRPFVAAWARFHPAAAFDHTLAWPFKIKQKIGVEAAMQGWALRDRVEARVALRQTVADHRDLEEDLFYSWLSGWASSDQEGLERYIAALSPVPRMKATARVVGTHMRTGGVEVTLRWADSILRDDFYTEEFKVVVFRHAARSVARWQPERAAAWALEHAEHEYAEDGPRVVAEQWATRDGRAAMEWVRERPDGTPREQAAREAFVKWLRSDPEAAREWLTSESLTAFHDPVINAYARLRDARAPEEAIGWCERILGSERRLSCFQAVASEWYEMDAEAAETWLQQSPLSEEARRAVRTPPKKRKRARPAARAPRADDSDVADDEL
jgi:hypothetical protein